MMLRPLVFFCGILLACKIIAIDYCTTNLNIKEIRNQYSEGYPVTNVTKVGWQILSTLERSIDVGCELFIYSLRQCPQSSIDKEYCRKNLKEACLYGKLFTEDIRNAFRIVNVLKDDVYNSIELSKAISATVTLDEEKAREAFLDRVKMWTSPPATSNRKNIDFKLWMTGKEQYENIVLYAYFKAVLLRTFSSYLEQDIKIDERASARILLKTWNIREEDDVPSDDEIDFVLNVVTNQTTKK